MPCGVVVVYDRTCVGHSPALPPVGYLTMGSSCCSGGMAGICCGRILRIQFWHFARADGVPVCDGRALCRRTHRTKPLPGEDYITLIAVNILSPQRTRRLPRGLSVAAKVKFQITDSRRRGTWYCAPPSVTLLPFVSTPGRDNHKHRISLMNHTEQSLPFSLGCQAVEIRDVVHRMPVDALDNIAS